MFVKNKKTQGGYTLLFAVITATLVLGVAVFILSVSKKQYALSVAGRDSMYAIYAADSGMECAIVANLSTTSPAQISCNGNSSNPTGLSFIPDGSPDTALWPPPAFVYRTDGNGMIVDLPGNTCARVTIFDGYYTHPISGDLTHKTIIESRGYNYCDVTNHTGPVPSSRTVERALRVTYQ